MDYGMILQHKGKYNFDILNTQLSYFEIDLTLNTEQILEGIYLAHY